MYRQTRILSVMLFAVIAPTVRAEDDTPPAPDEVVNAYMKSVQQSDTWKMADGFRIDKSLVPLEGWAKEKGLALRVTQTNFLAELLGLDLARVDAGTRKPVNMVESPLPPDLQAGAMPVETPMGTMRLSAVRDENDQARIKHLMLEVNKDDKSATYRVAPAKLFPLAIDHILSVSVVTGSDRTIDGYSARNRTLGEVVEDIARIADLDFVVPREAAGIRVSLDVKQTSAIQLLTLLGQIDPAWTCTVSSGDGPFGGAAFTNEQQPIAKFADVARTLANRDLYALVLPHHPKLETPMDALKQVLADAARQASMNRQKIVVAKALPPAPPAPEPAKPAEKEAKEDKKGDKDDKGDKGDKGDKADPKKDGESDK